MRVQNRLRDRYQPRWQAMWRALGSTVEPLRLDGMLDDLLNRYAETQRHYHTRQHLDECFAHLDANARLTEHAAHIECALWFHDAIYEPRAKDNEIRSARLARRAIADAGVSNQVAEHIDRLIMATCHAALPASPDEQMLVDIDLSILAASDERFAQYELQVREEYAWVPSDEYGLKRAALLRQFIERDWIYSTPWFRTNSEARARGNLSRSIRELSGGLPSA